MKFYYKIKTFVTLTLLLCIANACTKGYEKLNTNPSLVTETLLKPDNVFSMAFKESIFHIPDLGRLDGPGRISEFAGFMASESSGNPFKNMDYYFYFNNYFRLYLVHLNQTGRLTNSP